MHSSHEDKMENHCQINNNEYQKEHQLFQAIFDVCWSMNLDRSNPLNEKQSFYWPQSLKQLFFEADTDGFFPVLGTLLSRIHLDYQGIVLDAITNMARNNLTSIVLDTECRLIISSGADRWFRVVLVSIPGEPFLLVAGLADIHKRKQQEDEDNLLLIRYNLISRALTEGPWDMAVVPADPVNPLNEIWWSEQFRQVLGFSDEKDLPCILGYWSERIHDEDRERVLEAFSYHITDVTGQTPYSIDYRIRRKNGDFLWVHANGYTVRDAKGTPIRVAGTIRDIDLEMQKMIESQGKLSRYQEILSTLTKKQELNAIISSGNPLMNELGSKIEKYAKVEAPVLLTGESGVGKEVVTDLIHQLSDRKDTLLLKINCGAIPDFLLESELFGYDEGAFSGARKGGKIGFFELADNGTVLLDEIGDMPMPLQVKILRFVQSQEFYRVGGKKLIKVNTRIIAATNKNLEEMVETRQFREDLFYRLQVLTIHIPSLRERPGDIVPLALHFLDKYNKKYGMVKVFSPEIFAVLNRYSWKGNIRELENQIERLVVTTDSDVIHSDTLPMTIREEALARGIRTDEVSIPLYQDAKEVFEKSYLKQALGMYGSTRKTAEKIGVDHSTLVKKAARYGLELLKWTR